jgi:glycogen synthase
VSGLRVLTVGSMYPPHHLGGAELIWRSAVEALRERGHRVRVLSSDYRAPEPDAAIAEDPDVHRELRWYWHEHDFPRIGPLERLRLERANAAVLERHLAELEPDVVCWWSMGGMSLALLERVRAGGPPAVGVLLDDWLVYGPAVDGWQRLCRRLGPAGPLLGRLAGAPAPVDLGAAAHWLFMSETVRRHAREAGVDVAGSEIVYRGIDRARYEPGPDPGWRGELLYLGRIDPRKGIAVAIAALEHLPDCRLTVVGDGDRAHLAELERRAEAP